LTSQSLSPLLFWGKFSPNFNLKHMILTYMKDLPWKKWHKFVRFQRFLYKNYQMNIIWTMLDFLKICCFQCEPHKVPNVFSPSSQWMPWTKTPLLWFHNLSICLGCWIVICQIEKWVHGCIYSFKK
jgi:hypothetical protein